MILEVKLHVLVADIAIGFLIAPKERRIGEQDSPKK
jgi:hypothetical protein